MVQALLAALADVKLYSLVKRTENAETAKWVVSPSLPLRVCLLGTWISWAGQSSSLVGWGEEPHRVGFDCFLVDLALTAVHLPWPFLLPPAHLCSSSELISVLLPAEFLVHLVLLHQNSQQHHGNGAQHPSSFLLSHGRCEDREQVRNLTSGRILSW